MARAKANGIREFVCGEEELCELLSYWQHKLRLTDWRITTKIVRKKDLENEHAQAQVWANQDLRLAEISILDPIDYDGGEDWPQDIEGSLVHELTHLVFWFLESVDPEEDRVRYSLEEQAVEAIADALIAARLDKPSTYKAKNKKGS